MKGDFFVQCPKCGHRIPDQGDRCLYCGAWTRGEGSSQAKTESSALVASSGKMGKDFTGIQVSKEGIDYKKLEGLPLALRARVEEVLKNGDGKNGEIKTSSYDLPESLGRTGKRRKRMGFLTALKVLLKKD
jgi:hypothetical protein